MPGKISPGCQVLWNLHRGCYFSEYFVFLEVFLSFVLRSIWSFQVSVSSFVSQIPFWVFSPCPRLCGVLPPDGRKSDLLLPLRVRMCSLCSLWGLLPCVWGWRLISTQLRTPQGALSCPLPVRASPGPSSIPPNQRDRWAIPGCCSPKLSRGGRSGQKWGHLIRFSFLRDQGSAAWCLIDKNHCFIYFILVFSCFR